MTIVQLSIALGIKMKDLTERCFDLNIKFNKQISTEDCERIKAYVPEEEQFEIYESKINQ